MINHVSLGTNDIERARRFYDAIFNLLGLRLLKCDETGAHYGTGEILFSVVTPTNKQPATAGNGTHIAFQARSRKMVDEFHAIALKNGGRSDGALGIRPSTTRIITAHSSMTRMGNKIEAVSYSSE